MATGRKGLLWRSVVKQQTYMKKIYIVLINGFSHDSFYNKDAMQASNPYHSEMVSSSPLYTVTHYVMAFSELN